MKLATSTVSKCLRTLIAVLAVALGAQAEAQERAGVVTTLEGTVTVTRASLPQPAALKFKDDIFVRDRIATSKDSVARILLGGRAVVTVREHSVVTITEVPGVSTVDVVAGRAAVAVAREKMRGGDLVEVRTPNAVAGIRGTVIVAEVLDADHSVITVLKGVVDVKRLDEGRMVGNAMIVTALQRVTVSGGGPLSSPQQVTPDVAKELGQQFRVPPPRSAPPAATAAVNEGEVDRAARYLATIAPAVRSEHDVRRGGTDDDQDGDTSQDRRGAARRDTSDRIAKPDTAVKGDGGRRAADKTSVDAMSAVKASGRGGAAVSNLGEAGKSDRGNRKNRDRDR